MTKDDTGSKKQQEKPTKAIKRNNGDRFVQCDNKIVCLKVSILDFPGAQWLRICLLTQGTWVRAFVWGDPTCCRAIKPVSHNY